MPGGRLYIAEGEQKPDDLQSLRGGREGGVVELTLLFKRKEELDVRLWLDCCLCSDNDEEVQDPRGWLLPGKLVMADPVGL